MKKRKERKKFKCTGGEIRARCILFCVVILHLFVQRCSLFCVVILYVIVCAKMHTDAHIVIAACRPNTTSDTVTITASDFAYNFLLPFVVSSHCRDEDDAVQEIKSMPGICRYGINKLQSALSPLVGSGLKSVLIFGVPGNVEKVCCLWFPCSWTFFLPWFGQLCTSPTV